MKRPLLLFSILFLCLAATAQKKGKGKDKKAPVKTEIISDRDETPVADTANKFTGLIKYKMSTDDPADKDSMFIVFGENKIRVIMFNPGYKEGQVFESNYIANFTDSGFYILDTRNKTYVLERLGDRNAAVEFTLEDHKKTAMVTKFLCKEYSGEMKVKDDVYQAAALVSKQHSYLYAMDYDFLNIQPVVRGYKIVLGWRTKSPENENTYVVAYEILPTDVSSYFDLTGYKQK